MPSSPPPPSAAVRPATPADAEAVHRLLTAIDILETGRPQTDLHEVEAELKHPDVDLDTASWLGFHRERLVAHGLLRATSVPERWDVDHYVLPEHQELGLHLLERMRARAVGAAAERGADRAVLHLRLTTEPTTDTAALAAQGWRPVRRHHVLTRAVSPAADPSPAPPPGITVRRCTTEADRRTAHALLERAFAEHFDHRLVGYEQWRSELDGHRVDRSLMRIATVAGLGDAAVLLCRDDRESMGWVHRLGVIAEARGTGLGSHLLRLAFADFARRGRRTVGLGVDTENAGGALRLYERHGMALDHAVDTWELILPVPAH
jgi:mycothiol synthase